MKKHPNYRSELIAKSIDLTFTQALDLELEEALKLFRKREHGLLQDLHSELSGVETVELKRRFSEARIRLLDDKAASDEKFQAEWRRLERLGFSSADCESSMIFYLVRNLLRTRKNEKRVAAALSRLSYLVQHELPKESEESARHFAGVLDRLCRASGKNSL